MDVAMPSVKSIPTKSRPRRSQYSTMEIANLLHPANIQQEKKITRKTIHCNSLEDSSFSEESPDNVTNGILTLSQENLTSKFNKNQEKVIQDLFTRTTSRVQEIRKVFEKNASTTSARTTKPTYKKLSRNRRLRSNRRHTVAGVTFRNNSVSSSSESESEVFNQVLDLVHHKRHNSLLNRPKPLQGNTITGEKMSDPVVSSKRNGIVQNQEQVEICKNELNNENVVINFNGSMAEAFVDKTEFCMSEKLNRTISDTTVVSNQRRRKHRTLYASTKQVSLLNTHGHLAHQFGDDCSSTHLSNMTSQIGGGVQCRLSDRNVKSSYEVDDSSAGDEFTIENKVNGKNPALCINDILTNDIKQTSRLNTIKVVSSFDDEPKKNKGTKMSTLTTINPLLDKDQIILSEESDITVSESASTDRSIELLSSDDDDNCLNFYGRFNKEDFSTPQDNDKYNTFLDLSKIDYSSGGLATVEEEPQTSSSAENENEEEIVMPPDSEEQDTSDCNEMGLSIRKQSQSKSSHEEDDSNEYRNIINDLAESNLSAKVNSVENLSQDRSDSRISNSEDYCDCKSRFDEDSEVCSNATENDGSKILSKSSCQIVSVSPAEGICIGECLSPDGDSSYDIVSKNSDLNISSKCEINDEKSSDSATQDLTNYKASDSNDKMMPITKPSIDNVFKNKEGSTPEILNASMEFITGNTSDYSPNMEINNNEVSQKDIQILQQNVTKTKDEITTSIVQENTSVNPVTPTTRTRKTESLLKRRDRNYRRVSDPTGISRVERKLAYKQEKEGYAGTEKHYFQSGTRRLYEIILQIKQNKTDTKIRDIYELLESKGIRRSDPRLIDIHKAVSQEAKGENTDVTEKVFERICNANFVLIRNVLLSQLTIPGYEHFRARMQKIYEALQNAIINSKKESYMESKLYSDSTSYLSVLMQRKNMLDKSDVLSMSVCTVDGQRMSFGDKEGLYTLNSCADVFNYCMACTRNGYETVHWYVGRSKMPPDKSLSEFSFDSKGRVWNPFTKAGAIMTSSLLLRKESGDDHSTALHEFYRRLIGNENLCCDNLSYNLKRMFGHEEISLAYFLSAQKKLPPFAVTSPGEALEMSFQSACTATTCDSSSVAVATIAGMGACPLTGEQVFPEKIARNAIKTIQACSENFCRKDGIAVSWSELGSILIIIPGVMGITCFTQCQYPSTTRNLVETLVNKLTTEFNFALYRSLQDHRISDRKPTFDYNNR